MATKSFIKTIGSKGLLADYNTEGKKLQTELTAGDNVTIANNVISAANALEPKDISNDPNKDFDHLPEDNVLYYKNSSTDFANQPKKGAYRFIQWTSSLYYSVQIAIDGNNQIFTRSSYRKTPGDTFKTWSPWIKLQENLTFDTTPTAGSNNPVTSEGIYKSMYILSNPATPSSFTKDGKSYSFVCRTNVRAWKRAAFEGYAFPVDWQTFDMIRIRSIVYADPPTDSAIVSITCGKLVYEKFNFVQAIYNGYCYIFANNPFRPLYISPNKYIDSDTNSSSMTQDIFQTLTLTKITPSIDDVILEDTPKNNSTNPITSGGVKTAIDKLQSKLTFDTTPTAGSNNPVTSDGIKTALDSRIPAPTSTTGTQVLKCIDGVVQWVTE